MDLSLWPMMAEVHLLGFMERIVEMLDQIPWFVFFLPFQVWMFWDSLRREKWLWMWAIIFLWIPAVPYYFLVYRPSQNNAATQEKKIKICLGETNRPLNILYMWTTSRVEASIMTRDIMTDHDSKANAMAGEPSNAEILRELGKINNELGQIKSDVGQLKNDIGQLKTDVGQIKTWQKALTAGLAIVIAIAIFLHREQNDRITRVEERIVSRLETIFANQPTTACQCEKEN